MKEEDGETWPSNRGGWRRDIGRKAVSVAVVGGEVSAAAADSRPRYRYRYIT